MTSELSKCLSILFRQKGKDVLSEREFVYAVSMDLHWFPPKDAQKLLEISLKKGLLTLNQGLLSPAFELSEDSIQLDYRPPKQLIAAADTGKTRGDNLFLELVRKISASSKLPKKEIVSSINRTQDKMGVDAEVAALVIARGLGIEIGEDIVRVEEEIRCRKQ